MPIPNAELRLLDEYDDELEVLIDQRTGDAKKDSKIDKEIDQKLKVYLQQINTSKEMDPDNLMVRFHESNYHVYRAIRVFGSSVFMRKVAQGSDSIVKGVAAASIAKAQEKSNAKKAIEILDQALVINDNAYAHLIKANMLEIMGRKEEAKSELRYIIQNLQDQEESYITARKALAMLENPPKKGPCFVATACYGSYEHPDVLVFRGLRDNFLKKRSVGKAFVCWYYEHGPKAAQYVSRRPWIARWMRYWILCPLASFLRRFGF